MYIKNERAANKVFIIGATDKVVGVTNLVNRLTDYQAFSDQHEPTIGIETQHTMLELQDEHHVNQKLQIRIQITDIGSENRVMFGTTSSYLVNHAHQLFLVFDMTDKDSLINLSPTIREIQQKNLDIPILLIGTKSDLTNEIKVTPDDVEAFCTQNGINQENYFEVSSKTGDGIDALKTAMYDNARAAPAQQPKAERNVRSGQTGRYDFILSQNPTAPIPGDFNEKLDNLSKKRRLYKDNQNDPYAEIVDTIKEQINESAAPLLDASANTEAQERLKEINKNINRLQWTMGSMLNTGVNILITATIVGAIAGLIYDYCKSANHRTKGNPFLFVNKGLKQQVETIVAPEIKNLKPK